MPKHTTRSPKRKRPARPKLTPVCGICGGAHYATECKQILIGLAFPKVTLAQVCARCGGSIEFIGPYCILCALDRAIERLKNVH